MAVLLNVTSCDGRCDEAVLAVLTRVVQSGAKGHTLLTWHTSSVLVVGSVLLIRELTVASPGVFSVYVRLNDWSSVVDSATKNLVLVLIAAS